NPVTTTHAHREAEVVVAHQVDHTSPVTITDRIIADGTRTLVPPSLNGRRLVTEVVPVCRNLVTELSLRPLVRLVDLGSNAYIWPKRALLGLHVELARGKPGHSTARRRQEIGRPPVHEIGFRQVDAQRAGDSIPIDAFAESGGNWIVARTCRLDGRRGRRCRRRGEQRWGRTASDGRRAPRSGDHQHNY